MKKHKNIRLKGFDYTQPASYFITICAHQFKEIWGDVINQDVILNNWGQIVREEWYKTEDLRKNVSLDTFVLMPNHLHGIITIHSDEHKSEHFYYPQFFKETPIEKIERFGYSVPNSIPTIIKQFKATTTKNVRQMGFPMNELHWQKGYYERIIRNPIELERIKVYIQNNPFKWEKDKEQFKKLLDSMELIN